MANLNDIFSWFSIGRTPTADQFKQSWSSFWHKSEKVSMSAIFGLIDVLNEKATQEQIESLVNGVIKQDAVSTFADLAVKYPNPEIGWDVLVLDENTRYSWNGTKWVDLKTGVYDVDVITKSDLVGGDTQSYLPDMSGTVASAKAASLLVNSDAIGNLGVLKEVSINASDSGNLGIHILSKSGNVFTSIANTIIQVTSGIASYAVNLPVNTQGLYIGIEISTTNASVTVKSPSSVSYYGGQNGTAFTLIPNYNICYGFKIKAESSQRPEEIEGFKTEIVEASVDEVLQNGGVLKPSDLISNGNLRTYLPDMNGNTVSPKAASLLINADAFVSEDGRISKFYVNGVDSGVLTIHTLNKSGSVFTVVNSAIIQISAGIGNYITDIDIFAGQYVGIEISTTNASVKYFQTGKTGYWGGLNNTSLTLIAAGLISYGFDLSIGEGKPRPQEVEAFKQEILNEVGSIDPANDPMSGIQLYSYNMKNFSFAEHPEFVSNGWTANTEGITPSVAGLGGIVYINKQINIETKIQRVIATLGNNTSLALLTVGKEESTLKTIVSVNAGNNSLNIYDIYSGSSLPAIRATKVISFSIVAGRQYIVEMYRKGRANGIKITDFLTGQSDYLEVYPTQAVHGSDTEVYVGGLQYDVLGVCHLSGTTPTIKHISCGYFGKKSPLLWISGDSITYGYGTNDLSLTYAHLIGKMTGGDYVVSPRCGGKIGGILEKIQTECSIIKPKFVMVTIGTNQAASEVQLQQLVTDIKAIGSIPIINCIPCRTNGEQMTANNRILALGEYCCRFDLATAIDPTASTLKADLSLYVDGGVHPNTTGFQRMADRVRIDLPFLF